MFKWNCSGCNNWKKSVWHSFLTNRHHQHNYKSVMYIVCSLCDYYVLCCCQDAAGQQGQWHHQHRLRGPAGQVSCDWSASQYWSLIGWPGPRCSWPSTTRTWRWWRCCSRTRWRRRTRCCTPSMRSLWRRWRCCWTMRSPYMRRESLGWVGWAKDLQTS